MNLKISFKFKIPYTQKKKKKNIKKMYMLASSEIKAVQYVEENEISID